MITAVEVLCDWDGWVRTEGTNLSWEVLQGGELSILDGKQTVATHSQCWQMVRIAQ